MALLHKWKMIVIHTCTLLVLVLPHAARALDTLHEKPLFEKEEKPATPEQGSRDDVVETGETQPEIAEEINWNALPEVQVKSEPLDAITDPSPAGATEVRQQDEIITGNEPFAVEQSPNESLGLGGVLRRAYLSNPTLQAARQELMATHELLPQAMAGWKPIVAADADITVSKIDGSNFGGGDGSTEKGFGMSLDQPLYRGGRTVSQTAAAQHTIAARAATLLALEQDILREAATAYMDVVRDQALFDLSENNRAVIAKQLEATRDRFEVGELTRTDISQAEARLARAEADTIAAHGSLRTSQAIFEQVIGIPSGRLNEPSVTLVIPETVDESAALAETVNPQVVAATHAHRAAENDVDDVFGELMPQIGLFSSWAKTYDPSPGIIDKQTSQSVGLSASIPLYDAGAVRSRVRQAKQTANQRYIQILEMRRAARKQAISDWEILQAARAEIRSRISQVEASEIAQEGVEAETEVGQRTILDALDAHQELMDAQASLVSAKRNEIVASFSLAATLGLLSPERLGFPDDIVDVNENLEVVRRKIFDMGVDRLGSAE